MLGSLLILLKILLMASRYVHRVGRTARAGRKGCAVTFVTERERSLLKAIVRNQFVIANLVFSLNCFLCRTRVDYFR